MKRFYVFILFSVVFSAFCLGQVNNKVGNAPNYYEILQVRKSLKQAKSLKLDLHKSQAIQEALLYVDRSNANDGINDALINLGYSVTMATDWSNFSTLLENNSYDLVVGMAQSNKALNNGFDITIVSNYITAGGKMIFATWTNDDTPIANLFEADFTGRTNMNTVTLNNPQDFPNVTSPFNIANQGWGVFSIGLTPIENGEIVATFENGDAAMIKGNSGNTLMLGYLSDATPIEIAQKLFEDAVNNIDICSEDDVPPITICKDTVLYLDDNGVATILASDIDNGSSDNCEIDVMEIDKDYFSYSDIGIHSVTLTVIDKLGNKATCTSTVTIKRVVETQITEAVCINALPYIFGTQQITESGKYIETFPAPLGGDSIVSLLLKVEEIVEGPINLNICESELPYRYKEYVFTQVKDTTYTFLNMGCDYTYQVNLKVIPTPRTEIEETVCSSNLPFNFGTQSLSEEGTYRETFTSKVSGCDSLVTLHLSIAEPVSKNILESVCSSKLPYLFGSQSLTETGSYSETFIAANGCDSLVVLDLTVMPSPSKEITHQLCADELPYNFNGQNLTQAGTYTATHQSVNGCDSLVTLNLEVWELPQKPVFEIEENTLISGNAEQYFWFLNGNWIEAVNKQKLIIDKSGNYSLQVANENGCKSAISDTIYVTFSPAIDTKQVQLQVYPNPTQDYIYIKGLNVVDKAEIKLYNVAGELMLRQKAYNNVEKIDVQHLVNGVYLLSIEGTRNASIKIVKR